MSNKWENSNSDDADDLAIGISGKRWNKVTDEDVALWTRMIVDEGKTINQVARETDRSWKTIKEYIRVPKEVILRNAKATRCRPRRKGCEKPGPKPKHNPLSRRLYALVSNARQRAKKTGMSINITVYDVVTMYEQQEGKCSVSGLPFSLETRYRNARANPFAPSLDRIDSQKGYTKENVRLVLWAINVGIQEWGLEVFDKVARAYVNTRDN